MFLSLSGADVWIYSEREIRMIEICLDAEQGGREQLSKMSREIITYCWGGRDISQPQRKSQAVTVPCAMQYDKSILAAYYVQWTS